MIEFILFMSIFWMAQMSRQAGGGKPKLPGMWDDFLYAIPHLFFWPIIGPWAVLSYLGGVLGKRTGTAPYLDLGHDKEPTSKVNKVDWIIRPLKNKISANTYDAFGISLVGLVEFLVLGAVLICKGHFMAGFVALVYGVIFKSCAYIIGWAIIPNFKKPEFPEQINESTKIAEYLSGAFAGLGLLIVYHII